MADEERNYYEILGLTSKATSKEIAAAYRDLVLSHHPDRFTDPSEKDGAELFLKSVTEAYNTLSRPALRTQYDKDYIREPGQEPPKRPPQDQAREFFQQGMARVQSDPSGALVLFDYVLKLTPQDTQAMFQAGMIRLKSPKWRVQGAQQVEAAILQDPFNARFVTDYAKFLVNSGQALRAERVLSQALQYHASEPAVKELLALCRGEGQPSGGFGLFGKKK